MQSVDMFRVGGRLPRSAPILMAILLVNNPLTETRYEFGAYSVSFALQEDVTSLDACSSNRAVGICWRPERE